MSVLEFLSVGAAADQGAFHPVAKSSLERRFRDAGATFEERGGWLVPVSVPGEEGWLAHVGVADISHLAKFEVRPAGEPVEGDGIVWYPISQRRALVLCAPSLAPRVREQTSDRFVLDVTGALSVIAIVGPEADTVLRRLTHIHHFPSGGEVAHVTAHVLQRGGGYWLVFAQELGHYLSEVVLDRAGALGGGLVGVDALGAGS
jgi:glycine cleavage system aminomethyltransferase T